MPPIGICSLSSYLRQNGYRSDLFDLLLEFDTTVLHDDLRRPLIDLFAAARSDRAYDPAILTNLRFYIGLNRSYLAREVTHLYEEIGNTNPASAKRSPNPVRRFLALNAEKMARYDIVGLSIIFEEQIPAALILARWIKALAPDTKIVVGGSGAYPPDWRAHADLVVRGDGETALLAYVLSQAESAAREPGSSLAGEAPVRFHENLDMLPPPDYATLLANHQYLAPVRILPLAVTRGCYWRRCLFCAFGWRDSDAERCTAPYRRMSAAKVVADIANLMRDNETPFFYFSVDVLDPALLEEIADELIRTATHVMWSAEVRAEKQFLKPGLFAKMFGAGCRSLTCGFESFSQRILDSMQKGIRVEHSRRILDGLCDAGILPSIGYFMGWPGETPAEAAVTQNTVNALFETIPGNAAEQFVLVKDSPVVGLGRAGRWTPLQYDRDRELWRKQGMSWQAQNRQWLIFATNFYCDARYACFPVRGDGGYGLLYGARYPLAALGPMFRDRDSAFGILGRGRLTFYGFFHTRHYAGAIGAGFNNEDFLRRRLPVRESSGGSVTRLRKIERLDAAYDVVCAFIEAHRFSAAEQAFMRQVARFDYGLLRSCIGRENQPLVRVDDNGELVASATEDSETSFKLDFTIDIAQVARFAPFACIPTDIDCPVRFDLNGFHVIDGPRHPPRMMPTAFAVRLRPQTAPRSWVFIIAIPPPRVLGGRAFKLNYREEAREAGRGR